MEPLDNENPTNRFYTVSKIHPRSTVKRVEDKTRIVDQMTQEELNALDFVGKKTVMRHGKHNGLQKMQEPVVVGEIIKVVPDTKGNLICLSYNYGNGAGLGATAKIKSKGKTAVSLQHNYSFDPEKYQHKYSVDHVAYVGKPRRKGTHILYGCDATSEFIRTSKKEPDDVVKQLIQEAQNLSGIVNYINPTQVIKNPRKEIEDSIYQHGLNKYLALHKVLTDIPSHISNPNSIVPVEESDPMSTQEATPPPANTAAQQPESAPAPATQQPPAQTNAPVPQDSVLTNQEYIKNDAEYAEVAKRLDELKVALNDKSGTHDPSLAWDLSFLLQKMVTYEKQRNEALQTSLKEKEEKELNNTKVSMQEYGNVLKQLAQTEGGKAAAESYKINPTRIDSFMERISKVNDPHLLNDFSDVIPFVAAASKGHMDQVNTLGARNDELFNSLRTRKIDAFKGLLNKQPIQHAARHAPGVPAPQHRFNNLPQTPREYSQPAQTADPVSQKIAKSKNSQEALSEFYKLYPPQMPL